MRVRMTKLSAGPEGCFNIGAIREVSDAEGKVLIAAEAAELASADPEDAGVVENATTRSGKESATGGPQRRGKGRSNGKGDDAASADPEDAGG